MNDDKRKVSGLVSESARVFFLSRHILAFLFALDSSRIGVSAIRSGRALRTGAVVAPAPAANPFPAPSPAVQLPPITQYTCERLAWDVKAGSCQFYSLGDSNGVGCSCFVDGNTCPTAPHAQTMGFTGSVISSAPLSLPEMEGLVRITCVYRQWKSDPTLTGALAVEQNQVRLNSALAYLNNVWAKMSGTPRPFGQNPIMVRNPQIQQSPLAFTVPAPAPANAATCGRYSLSNCRIFSSSGGVLEECGVGSSSCSQPNVPPAMPSVPATGLIANDCGQFPPAFTSGTFSDGCAVVIPDLCNNHVDVVENADGSLTCFPCSVSSLLGHCDVSRDTTNQFVGCNCARLL